MSDRTRRSPPPPRVVGYLRVSTAEQAERGYGLDVQRERVEAFCRHERLSLAEVFADPGVAGTTPLEGRAGLTGALESIRASGGAIDGLVVARFDRLARDTLQALLIEQAFLAAGARVLYADGPNGEDFTFLREVMHAMAAEQRRQLVARLAAGRQAKAARGGYAGGRPAFGYEARDGQLHPVPHEAQVIRWIFDRVARDRWTVRRVAAALDAEGTLGRRWHPTGVHRIVRRVDYKRGPMGARIVDAKVWNRANAALQERSSS